jgi:hypothetical protein
MDAATASLLRALETSPTDLRKLVASVEIRRQALLRIPAAAIERWTRDDPDGWAAVRAWLGHRGVEVVVAGGAPAPDGPRDRRG